MANSNRHPWNVEIDTGFFYIEDREYYLYGDKQILEYVPVSGLIALPPIESFEIVNAPIVVTDKNLANGATYDRANAAGHPFAKTWEPPVDGWDPTPHKYEHVEDLTGWLETYTSASGTTETYSFELQDHQFKIEYGTEASGLYYPIITLDQGIDPVPTEGPPVIVEYEGPDSSGYYLPPYLDFNPVHSPNFVDKFVVVRDALPVPEAIDVINRRIYMQEGALTVDLMAEVNTAGGAPVPDATVHWEDLFKVAGPAGSFTSATTTTGWDGRTKNTYTMPSYNPGDANTDNFARGFHVIATTKRNGVVYSSGVVRLEHGVVF